MLIRILPAVDVSKLAKGQVSHPKEWSRTTEDISKDAAERRQSMTKCCRKLPSLGVDGGGGGGSSPQDCDKAGASKWGGIDARGAQVERSRSAAVDASFLDAERALACAMELIGRHPRWPVHLSFSSRLSFLVSHPCSKRAAAWSPPRSQDARCQQVPNPKSTVYSSSTVITVLCARSTASCGQLGPAVIKLSV